MFESMIVGVDREEGGRDAIALANILRAEDAKLTLAYVYHGDPHLWRGSSPPFEAAEIERARELLEAREEARVKAQLRWEGSLSVGRDLHELAEEIGAEVRASRPSAARMAARAGSAPRRPLPSVGAE